MHPARKKHRPLGLLACAESSAVHVSELFSMKTSGFLVVGNDPTESLLLFLQTGRLRRRG